MAANDSSNMPSGFQRFNDLLPVKTSVFDEDFARVPPANDHSSQMNSWNIAFQRVGIKRRFSRFRIELHAQALDKRIVRMVAGQGKDLLGRQASLARPVLHHNLVARDFYYACLE